MSTPPPTSLNLGAYKIYQCYESSKYLSIKHSSYFQVYEELLEKYRNKKITFVEIGVLNGGSLFMWREYFGPQARIIGIDLNPIAKKWESSGFEIYVGSQSNSKFWDEFFASVGDVDIVLDDGGHTNDQQIVTAVKCIPHIRDNGVLIVEDTHSSYMRSFGNPSRYSFVSYSKHLIDAINSRFPKINASKNGLAKSIYSIGIYESIICFNIDRSKCFVSSPTSNNGISSNAQDWAHQDSILGKVDQLSQALSAQFGFLDRAPFIQRIRLAVFSRILFLASKVRSLKLRKYFS